MRDTRTRDCGYSARVVGRLGVLASLAAPHLALAAGATWPAGDSVRLAVSVAGLPHVWQAGCLIVATGLGSAAAAVSGIGGRYHLVPITRVCIAAASLVRGAGAVSIWAERNQETPRVLGRLEALEDPFALTRRQVRVFSPIVQSCTAPMHRVWEHPSND